MRKVFAWGGIAASIVLIAFGIGSIVVGLNGRSEVRNDISRENIVGTPDMTPEGITAEAEKAGLSPSEIDVPSTSVAGKEISNGDRAKAFASYMRIHALEATGGYTYAEMGRYLAKPGTAKAQLAPGGGTSNPAFAVIFPNDTQPTENVARNIWVTETALSTALTTSYFAERVALFSVIMGVALLLTGIGFLVLTLGALFGVGSLTVRSKEGPDKTSATT